jgi:hypothetical protein
MDLTDDQKLWRLLFHQSCLNQLRLKTKEHKRKVEQAALNCLKRVNRAQAKKEQNPTNGQQRKRKRTQAEELIRGIIKDEFGH